VDKEEEAGFFRTYSPQGDGNTPHASLLAEFKAFFRTYSPQGDGNTHCTPLFWGEDWNMVFQNLFPARGRKPPIVLLVIVPV